MSSPFIECMSCNLNSGAITSIKFNSKGNQIGVATSVGHLFIFNEGISEPSIEFPPIDGPINQISWDISSTFIFAVTEAGSIWRYNISTLSTIKVFSISSTSFLTCESSNSNSYIAVGSTDGDLSLFKTEDIKDPIERDENNENYINTIKAHSDSITGISFRSDGLQLITCSYDSLVRIWGVDLICTQSFSFKIPILSVLYQSSGKMFFICCSDNSFKLISINGNVKKNNTIDIKNSFIIGCLNIYNNNDSIPNIVIGLNAGVIVIYTQKVNLAGEFQSVITVQKNPFYAFDVHPSGFMIASGGGPNEMNFKLWKMQEEQINEHEKTNEQTSEKTFEDQQNNAENENANEHSNEKYFEDNDGFDNENDDAADKSDEI